MTESLIPQEVQALKKEILSTLHCALPGTDESFDADTQTASVRPAAGEKDPGQMERRARRGTRPGKIRGGG